MSEEFLMNLSPLLELHGVADQLQRARGRTVELQSGGYLIIDQTEAMTAIDVNSGSFVDGRNQNETGLKTNLEAAAGHLLDEESSYLVDLGELIGKTLSFTVEPPYNQEQFDIILL